MRRNRQLRSHAEVRRSGQQELDARPYELPNGTMAYPLPHLHDDASFNSEARRRCGGHAHIFFPAEENSAGIRLYQCYVLEDHITDP
jgi:hypothetical protein